MKKRKNVYMRKYDIYVQVLIVCSLYGKIKRGKIDLVTIKRMKIGWFIFSWENVKGIHDICLQTCTLHGIAYGLDTYMS